MLDIISNAASKVMAATVLNKLLVVASDFLSSDRASAAAMLQHDSVAACDSSGSMHSSMS